MVLIKNVPLPNYKRMYVLFYFFLIPLAQIPHRLSCASVLMYMAFFRCTLFKVE